MAFNIVTQRWRLNEATPNFINIPSTDKLFINWAQYAHITLLQTTLKSNIYGRGGYDLVLSQDQQNRANVMEGRAIGSLDACMNTHTHMQLFSYSASVYLGDSSRDADTCCTDNNTTAFVFS